MGVVDEHLVEVGEGVREPPGRRDGLELYGRRLPETGAQVWGLNVRQQGPLISPMAADADAEFAGLVKRLDAIKAKTDPASTAERNTLQAQLAAILAARRKNDRFQCFVAVEIVSATGRGTGTITNVGAGGAFVKTALALERFAPVTLTVSQLGRFPAGTQLKGQVRWVKPASGIGLAFEGLGKAEQEALQKVLGTLIREQPPLPPE
jgi:hypothetical protein